MKVFTLTLGLLAFPACCAETPLEQTVARLATHRDNSDTGIIQTPGEFRL